MRWSQESGAGVMLEGETPVDPFGSSLPKYGIAFFDWEAGIEPMCARMAGIARAPAGLLSDDLQRASHYVILTEPEGCRFCLVQA